MPLYPVYPLWDITPVKGSGCTITDNNGQDYTDLYGGHAVISIGHSHPTYVKRMQEQMERLAFYSNSVRNPLQEELADQLAAISGYTDYRLFLCNSGAEANENALKLASFQTGRNRVLAVHKAFHGRTSGAVAVTDNPKINAPFNTGHSVDFAQLNDITALKFAFEHHTYAAVIIEGIQGVAGIHLASSEYWKELRKLCDKYGTFLIADEVQSGCGRTGNYFAHSAYGIKADLITMAKGIGNGFPVGAVLISPAFDASFGQLGTTFGGNHLACTAALAVIEVMKEENLMENAVRMGAYFREGLATIQKDFPEAIKEVRGTGLMIGVELNPDCPQTNNLRNRLLFEFHVFTGAAGPQVIRLLPPLCVSTKEADTFLNSVRTILNEK